MKVGIITYHFPYNCGATLQCLALQTKLESMGHEVKIINYRPWYHQNRYTPLKNPFIYAIKRFKEPAPNLLKRILRFGYAFLMSVYSWRNFPKIIGRHRKFEKVIKGYLHETRVYRSLNALKRNPPKCDMYISGSDQLWNATMTEGSFDAAYFLDFGAETTGKMTYSVGTNFSNLKDPAGAIRDLVKNLDVISLRETFWLSAVEEATEGKIPTHIDLDPTMLLREEDYSRFIPKLPSEKEPYILIYTMPGQAQPLVNQCARRLSKALKMKIIDVCGNPGFFNKKIEDNRVCGPDEFMAYIKNAEYVLTNSFHGTVFSVLFRKKFVTIPHAQTGNRVTELLDKLGLSDRYFYSFQEAADNVQNDIDYDAVHSRLAELRKESSDFLAESIEKYGNKGE